MTYANYLYKSIRDNEKAYKRQFVIDVGITRGRRTDADSYTHQRAHETGRTPVSRPPLEQKTHDSMHKHQRLQQLDK